MNGAFAPAELRTRWWLAALWTMVSSGEEIIRRRIRLEGLVQGVGFRPYIYRLATALGLTGFVRNDVVGVNIEVEGSAAAVNRFLESVPTGLPKISRVNRVEVEPVPPTGQPVSFAIIATDTEGSLRVPVTPDAHVCDDCLREMADREDRRYRYPFINCTQCGPRFTIVERAPYDRYNTTMAHFTMCAACRREYEDPHDRRFHAQPLACPACGPQVWLTDPAGRRIVSPRDPIEEARRRLLAGEVVAVKGIGGFHLAAVATSEPAVSTVRRRKGRGERKPFALMVRDLDQARMIATITEGEADLLHSTARPIVLLQRLPTAPIAPSVAPGLETVGLMLPYSPLHYLLLDPPMPPLVMTSGNPSEEPITTDNEDAIAKLGPLCDALLLHDRPICSGCDDSVAQVIDGNHQVLRRSRGYVPEPLHARRAPVKPGILALGGEMKAAICLSRPGQLIMGRHLGDVTNAATQLHLRIEIERMTRLFDVEPQYVAHDLHPDYFTSRLAEELCAQRQLAPVPVQHHHAHLASCLAENDFPPDQPVLGIVFDGTGLGRDGTIWGGEFLVGSYGGVSRAAHLRPIVLPGGEAAIRNPFRVALGCVLEALGPAGIPRDLPAFRSQQAALLEDLASMVRSGIGCTRSSGMGRLFDAVAALVGVPGGLATPISYEAQPAMELEAAATRSGCSLEAQGTYPFALDAAGEIDWRPLIGAVVEDVRVGADPSTIAARFHATVIRMTVAAAEAIAASEDLRWVALTGGCFHNRLLIRYLTRDLHKRGFRVLSQERFPCGDGGLALGQAAVASMLSTDAG